MKSASLELTPSSLKAVPVLLAGYSWLVLWAGAMVTSTGSGLAVPDWPLSYGMVFPPMVGGILYEHGHRLMAGGACLLTLLQTLLFEKAEAPPPLRNLARVALLIVLLQASLGGLTVLLGLSPTVSVCHALLGQTFFCVAVSLAALQNLGFHKQDTLPGWECSWILTGMFFLQLFTGASTRHLKGALAIPDFPTVFGGWIPHVFSNSIAFHYAHRVGALLLVLAFASFTAYQLRRQGPPSLIQGMGLLAFWMSLQILLGASVVWFQRPAWIASAHLAVGALCLATSLLISLRCSGFLERVR